MRIAIATLSCVFASAMGIDYLYAQAACLVAWKFADELEQIRRKLK